ncbi:MAG: Sensor protein ZraS [Syntrophus sp. PtaU1.Bin208]|nr:MAG: Sensor protein ZraS [Syntrophus sp. PtaU1.Bin208]
MKHNLFRMGLFLLLTFFSAALIYITSQNVGIARSLAAKSLENTALALSTAAESALRLYGSGGTEQIQEIFSDRVVAYALIAASDGTILFHTSPGRVGAILTNEEKRNWQPGSATSRQILLGTGIPAYEFNFTLHQPDGGTELLRLVLHATQTELVASWTNRMRWMVGSALLLLWTGGFFLERTAARTLKLQAQQEEQKRLTLIGQMTAVLAHEIRNALAGVKGYAQWAHEKIEDSQPAKTALTAVLQGTSRIETLVNELLLFARDETFSLESIDLLPLVREAIRDALSSREEQRGIPIEVNIEEGMQVKGDREKLYRTLVNGIRNALEATGKEGTIRITSSLDDRWVQLSIADTGLGLPEGKADRIFSPFFTTKTNGTGLGLAYAKKVIEGMGGIITLNNRSDAAGAVLSIRLPSV